MRRYLLLVLFAVVLVLPLVLRQALGLRTQAVTGSAGDAELVIMTAHQEGIRREFAEAFSRWHRETSGRGVVIHYRYFGASDIVKYFEAARETLFRVRGTYQVDLVWGGGDSLFESQLKQAGYLQPLELDPALLAQVYPRADLNGVALYDQDWPPSWFGTALSSYGIVFNKDVLRYLGLPQPQTWRDLTDPRYMGWLALADPTRSASARQAYMVIVERAMADAAAQGRSEDQGWADGMGLVRLIASNARVFTESSSIVPILVSTGDAAAGTAIDFYGRAQVDAVGDQRMGYVEPTGATAINPDPIALVRGAEHRELAVRFIEYVLSEPGQRLWNTRPGVPGGPRQTALRRLPIRPSVYSDMRNFVDQVNPYAAAAGFNKSAAREKTWGIIGELIEISCIDLLEELTEARQAILSSPHADRLDARLGRFPFDQAEALLRAAQWSAATPIQRLQLKRRWTEQFRQEYRQLRLEAARRP